MFTKKFVKRSFKFKFHVKVWSCNLPLSVKPAKRIVDRLYWVQYFNVCTFPLRSKTLHSIRLHILTISFRMEPFTQCSILLRSGILHRVKAPLVCDWLDMDDKYGWRKLAEIYCMCSHYHIIYIWTYQKVVLSDIYNTFLQRLFWIRRLCVLLLDYKYICVACLLMWGHRYA